MGKKGRSFDRGTIFKVTESVEALASSCDDSFDSIFAEEVEEVQRQMFLAARDLQERAVRLYAVIRIKKSERKLQEIKEQAAPKTFGEGGFGKSEDDK